MNFIKILAAQHLTRYLKIPAHRNYPRWTSRDPPDERNPEDDKDNNNTPEIRWRFKGDEDNQDDEHRIHPQPKAIKTKKQHKINTTDMLETVIDGSGNFVYTKMKNNDARVSQLLTDVKSKKQAKRHLVLLEGRRLIQDALLANCTLKYLLFSRKQDVEAIKSSLPLSGAKLYKMPLREMQMWSDLTTSPGIMGLFRTPDIENYIPQDESLPLTIYCDNIREPGNLGAILRVAASVSCKSVHLSTGCTNLWDCKVTRSAAGAHFRVQIKAHQNIDHLREILNKENTPTRLFIADNNIVHVEKEKLKTEETTALSSLVNQIPIVPYYAIDMKQLKNNVKGIVLVIGGETTGLSADVYKLAKEFDGVRLNIPMKNGIDSLNSGTAFGIIAFEFCKEFNANKMSE